MNLPRTQFTILKVNDQNSICIDRFNRYTAFLIFHYVYVVKKVNQSELIQVLSAFSRPITCFVKVLSSPEKWPIAISPDIIGTPWHDDDVKFKGLYEYNIGWESLLIT